MRVRGFERRSCKDNISLRFSPRVKTTKHDRIHTNSLHHVHISNHQHGSELRVQKNWPCRLVCLVFVVLSISCCVVVRHMLQGIHMGMKICSSTCGVTLAGKTRVSYFSSPVQFRVVLVCVCVCVSRPMASASWRTRSWRAAPPPARRRNSAKYIVSGAGLV